MKSILILTISLLSFNCFSQSTIFGKWISIDDDTNEKKSIVEIYKSGDKAFGKVIFVYPKVGDPENPLCTECGGKKYNQPINGMEVISAMKYDVDDKEWEDGEILDPENGTTYDCKLWVEDGKLKVRGYIGFIYRTQTWERKQ